MTQAKKKWWSCQRRTLVEENGFVWGWLVDFCIDLIRLSVIKCCRFFYSVRVSNAWCTSWIVWPHVRENATKGLWLESYSIRMDRFEWINIFKIPIRINIDMKYFMNLNLEVHHNNSLKINIFSLKILICIEYE